MNPYDRRQQTTTKGAQGLRLDDLDPALERTVMRHGPEVDPTEPAQDEATRQALLGLAITPFVQLFRHHQAENGIPRRGMATSNQRQRIPSAEIGADLLVEPTIVQEGIDLTEDRIGVMS